MSAYSDKVPHFKLKFIFNDNFHDNGFLHTVLVLYTESIAGAILTVTAFEPCCKDFTVTQVTHEGEKLRYTPGEWKDFIYRCKYITGAFQPDLFNQNKTA